MTQPREDRETETRVGGKLVVFSVLLCILIASVASYTVRQWNARKTWVRVEGRVVRVEPAGWWDEASGKDLYVLYAFDWRGKPVQGSRFHIKEDSINDVGRHLASLRAGSPVAVFVDPADPSRAVLNVDYIRDGFLLVLVSVGFLAATAAMVAKERGWARLVAAMARDLPASGYEGETPLPPSRVLRDEGGVLWLNTGMSVFWTMGIPFLLVSFAGLAWMALSTQTLNPGWGLLDYGSRMAGTWGLGAVLGILLRLGVRHELWVDGTKREIRERRRLLGAESSRREMFSRVEEVRLYRDVWRADNPLRYWLLYIQDRSHHSWHVLHRHRDEQPSAHAYLAAIKARMDHLFRNAPGAMDAAPAPRPAAPGRGTKTFMALALLCFAATATRAGAAEPRYVPVDLHGTIVHSGLSGGQWDLWAADPGSGRVHRVTSDPQMERFPAVSPDGSGILFIGDEKGIWMLDARTGKKQAVPLPPGAYGHPAWSRKGHEFAYVAYAALPTDSSELWRVTEAGGKWGVPERLTTFPPMVQFPDYAPGGKAIACAVFKRDPNLGVVENIALLVLPEKNMVPVTADRFDNFDPEWSPDGTRIAYASNRSGNYDLWVRPMDGSPETRITRDPGMDSEPSWEPSGQRIVFVSNRTGARELWIVSAQGGPERQLTDQGQSVASPRWVK